MTKNIFNQGNPVNDPWTSPGLPNRVEKWFIHRTHRSILNSPDWSVEYLIYKPEEVTDWKAALLWSAASAAPEVVRIALENCADPTGSLLFFELADEGAMLVRRHFYYSWCHRCHPRSQARLKIRTPIQAAVAGGSMECFQLIAASIKLDKEELDGLTAWLTEFGLDTYSQVEGGLVLAEYNLRHHETMNDKIFWNQWINYAQSWMRSAYGTKELKYPQLVETWRRLNQFCSEFGMHLKVPPPILAQLL